MAHITEIKIEGLLGRKDPIHIQLNRDVNVFFGENGCGKTTLLKVLDAALSRDGPAMEQLPVTKAVVDIFSLEDERVYRHTWERGSEPTIGQMDPRQLELLRREYVETLDGRILLKSGRSAAEWKLTPSRKKRPNANRWAHTFLPTTRLYFNDLMPGRVSNRAQFSESELDQAFSDSVNKAWLQFYTKTLTEVRTIQESGLREVLRQVLNPKNDSPKTSASDADGIYTRVANFLARQSQSEQISLGSLASFRKRYEEDNNLRQIVGNLDNVERKIELTMVPINSFLDTISRLFSRGKSLKLTNNELQILLADDRALPISQLSSGEKHLIKILLSTMTAGFNSVLIDEPELSMHIDWQQVFVKTIHSLNPKCQLILASHSPEVMAELPDEYIFKL
ncbi:AAA family ATPase [Variovorax paradoxus]|uniref:AAA family ATPase n=1 Tax=Variovorax paradoxus TaxID=34073 RepID=UPI0029C6E326|nr:AAA family ATPase [Variovorax paradoxus]WPH19852.1 AAA family ATPase [Variovorax paradoxus]